MPFKLIGVLFFSFAFLMSPCVLTELSRHYFVFSLVFFVLGLCCYFEIFGLGRKIAAGFKYFENHNGWGLLIAQSIVLILYLLSNKNFLSYQLHAGWGDEPSYVGFDFSSWTSIFGSYRTAGLPVILKIYHLAFKDFYFWPHVQMICYILSIFFLYGCFLRFGFNRILALLVVSMLLWDQANYQQFLEIKPESFAAIFLHLAIGSMLLAVREWSWKRAIPLGIIVFFLYQIRPNFSFVPILIPLWAAGISLIHEGFDWVRIQRILVRFSMVGIVPLLLFCLLRLAVVGQFSISMMSGGYLCGHAVHYLNEHNIQYLSGDVKKLADEILARKRRLTPPNNLSPFDWIQTVSEPKKIEMQAMAFGVDLMTAWGVAIKQLKGVEPFDDPNQNIEPWKYTVTLSGFHTRYYDLETERLLMKFSKEVLAREGKRYLHWLAGGSFYGMKIFLDPRSFWLVCLGLLGIAKLFYLLWAQELDPARLKRWHQDTGILTMVGASIFIFGFIPVVFFNFPFPRLLDLISIYMLPVFACLVLPPFWLKREKV